GMLNNLNNKAISILLRGQIYIPQPRPQQEPQGESQEASAARQPEVKQAMPERPNDYSRYKASKEDLPGADAQRAAASARQGERPRPEPMKAAPKIGRNDPCPCGSGKKYKNCHGRGL
ncbi:MAG: SEC-C domain-containing protein, partial [Muribaculaceae bacterium]|nr:SEC-C domain-containing protein [Muribaculaceae bacterium]